MTKTYEKCPHFVLKKQDGTVLTEKDIQNKCILFYFYPKDNTPGCTLEGQLFSQHLDFFIDRGIDVYGVSKDSIQSHEKFCQKYQFRHTLLSDESTFCEDLGIYCEKKMYGKSYMGIVRTTLLVDNGQIVYKWDNVKVKTHIDTVMETIEALSISKTL